MAARPKSRKTMSATGRQQYYLIQFSYTAAAWDDLLKNQYKRDRVAAVRDLVTSLGGCFAKITFECEDSPTPKEKFGSFGDHDVVVLLAFPDDEAAAAFAMAIASGGGVTSVKTTRILPWDQMMRAMGKAAQFRPNYVAPGTAR